MMKKVILIGIILFWGIGSSVAQYKEALKSTFYDAEYYMLYEDYNEALNLYLTLVRDGLNNAYIQHRIGECYLNIPGQKNKSIPYLEKACEDIATTIKEGSIKETKAPVRAVFYLACAYQSNNQLDKAIETFNWFKNELADQKIYNTDYVDRQIESCKVAKDLISHPLAVKTINAGELINNNYSNILPVLSSDESTMLYVSKLKFYDAIFYAKKDSADWAAPLNITPDLQSDGNLYTSHLSCDGKTLVLIKSDNFNSDIYLSKFSNGKWTIPEKLNKHINTKYRESFASITSDGKKLYFVSDRKGGFGGMDIYVSVWDEKTNDWGKAENLGSTINTAFNEETAIICEKENKLYFSSQGHYNMGGYDIFCSDYINGEWSAPENLGYPINTTDDNIYFYPIGDGKQAYISRYDENGYGMEDIIKIEIVTANK